MRVHQQRREFWSPSIVVVCGLIAAFGGAIVVLTVYVAVHDLVGTSLTGHVGIARRAPVWLVWVGVVVGFFGGLSLARDNVTYLVRVARGRVPRLTSSTRTRRR